MPAGKCLNPIDSGPARSCRTDDKLTAHLGKARKASLQQSHLGSWVSLALETYFGVADSDDAANINAFFPTRQHINIRQWIGGFDHFISHLYAGAFSCICNSPNGNQLLHRSLLFSGFQEWGANGTLRYDPGGQGLGLNAQVTPAWGTASSGAGMIWDQPDAGSLAGGADLPASPAAQIDAHLGCGLCALDGRGLLTPYSQTTLVEGSGHACHLGTRLDIAGTLNLSLQAAHRLRRGDGTGTRGPGYHAVITGHVRLHGCLQTLQAHHPSKEDTTTP